MKLNNTIQNELDKLTDEIKDLYGLRKQKNKDDICIVIETKDTYINIHYDEKFLIEETEYCFEIRNKRIDISLFKDVYFLHITVFD